jgi:nucleoside-diphosphate-sugar epimerase
MASNDLVLVTGATGFIGSRLVEFLASRGKRIRVTTSEFGHCPRIARFPVEMIKADLRQPVAFEKAAEGCDTIFHLAYRFGGSAKEQRNINLNGTLALARAAIKHRVRRFVHFSSVAAYGIPITGELTEGTKPQPTRDVYSLTKRKIDEALRDLSRSAQLPLAILQPTVVYGPYGNTWTVRLLEQVKSGRIALPRNGLGLCNAVYVDDVVRAAIRCMEADTATGETFLISGNSPVTWREFYRAYEKMARKDAVVELSENEFKDAIKRCDAELKFVNRIKSALARRPGLRAQLLNLPPQRWIIRTARILLPRGIQQSLTHRYKTAWQLQNGENSPLYVPDVNRRLLYASSANVRIEKARDRLGYLPDFDLNKGMSRTAEWAAWANLIVP